MPVFDAGNFQEGGATVSNATVITAYAFQESPAHNRGTISIFPQIEFGYSLGAVDFATGIITAAAALLPYIPVASGDDYSEIDNLTNASTGGVQFSYGLFNWPTFASGTGVLIAESDGYGVAGMIAIAPQLSKFKIFGPASGVVTTHVATVTSGGSGSGYYLQAPTATMTLSLAGPGDSQEFICPTGTSTTDFNCVIWWPNDTSGSLPPFPIFNPFASGQFMELPI